jgi:hypothetical protein
MYHACTAHVDGFVCVVCASACCLASVNARSLSARRAGLCFHTSKATTLDTHCGTRCIPFEYVVVLLLLGSPVLCCSFLQLCLSHPLHTGFIPSNSLFSFPLHPLHPLTLRTPHLQRSQLETSHSAVMFYAVATSCSRSPTLAASPSRTTAGCVSLSWSWRTRRWC